MCPRWNALAKGLAAIIGLPYFIISSILSLPLWTLSLKIRKSVKDPAFRNTVSFGVRLALAPVLFLVYAALAFSLTPWWLAAIILLTYLTSYNYFHDYIEGCRRWFSDIRLMKNKKLYKEFKSIVKGFQSL
jgi:hypothetical protein